jgi:POT family proton-dependent oligopeptide transporter
MAEALDTTSGTVQQTAKFPSGIPYIIGNEFAERFNYYGMRAILATFLVKAFFLQQTGGDDVKASALANEQVHFFIFLNYFMPFLGGLLADWFWGKYRTILWLSLVYCIGSITLAWASGIPSLGLVNAGLWLIATGSGGIKPCVSANVGDQFDKSNEGLIPKAFSMFYFSINAGSLISMALTPILYERYGATVAFGLPGIVMLMATIMFWLGRSKYKRVPPSGPKRENFVAINFDAMKNGFTFENIKNNWSPEAIDGVKAVWRVLSVFAFAPVFWALYDQNSSEWVLQARNLDLTLISDIKMLPEQVQVANALLILIFIPLFAWGLYPMVEKMGIKVTPLRKIGAGFVFTALSFVVIAMIQQNIDAGGKPSVWWQLLAYAILTAGEVLISITGLEYAYTRSPKSMKSTIMAFWLLTVSAGNFIVSLINKNIAAGGFFARFSGASYYWLFFGVCSITALLFMMISPRIKEKVYLAD